MRPTRDTPIRVSKTRACGERGPLWDFHQIQTQLEEFHKIQEMLEVLRALGVRRAEYDLASAYGRF